MDRDSIDNISDHLVKKNSHKNENRTKEINLSSLTAKYNKSRNVGEVFVRDSDHLSQKAASLSDGDGSESESSSTSLAALVAKHNVKKVLQTKSDMISIKENTLEIQQDNIRLGDNIDESSDSDVDGSSLLSFALKHKHSQTIQPNNLCVDTDSSKYKGFEAKAFHTQKSDISDLTVKFKAANFSDDSDSDNSSKPLSIVPKHLKKTSKEGLHQSGYDCGIPKPRELLVLAKGHRLHTKSESDQSNTQIISGNLIGINYEKEISTSLGSLRGRSHEQTDFQFSLGCAIPNSFRSKHVSPLSLSLSSFQAPLEISDVKNSFSDPDVSTKMKTYTDSTKNSPSLSSHIFRLPDNNGFEIERIDLFSAIKSSSSTKTNNSGDQDDTDMSVTNDHDDEKIVTLLDTLCVEEEMVSNDDPEKHKRDCYGITDFANISHDSCMNDASFMLGLKLRMRTKKCSSLGKVVCRRWRVMNTPYIRSQKLQTSLTPFDFSTPSPDDVVDSYRRQ